MSDDTKKESLVPSLRGKTSDARQVVNDKGQWLDKVKSIDPMKWIISYGPEAAQPGQTLMGTVPLMLMGHEDMDPSEFRSLIQFLSKRKQKTTVPPAINASEEPPVDLRKFVMNGCFSDEFRMISPKSHRQLKDAVRVTYDTANFPQLNGALTTFLEENSPMTLQELKGWLKRAAKRFKNPTSDRRTMGNVDDLFWDYFRKTSPQDTEDDDFEDYGQGSTDISQF